MKHVINRRHGCLTAQVENYFDGAETTLFHYIEALYDTTEFDEAYWLLERFDRCTKVAEFVLRCRVEIEVDVVSWQETSDLQEITAILGKAPSLFKRAVSWETTRKRANDMWIDYVNWGIRGRFGAYAVVVADNSNSIPLPFDLVPCASKYVAVMSALESPLLGLMPNSLMVRNAKLITSYPVHDGSLGKATLRWFSFPDKPMNVGQVHIY